MLPTENEKLHKRDADTFERRGSRMMKRRKTLARRVVLAALITGVVTLSAGVLLALQVNAVREHLTAALEEVSELRLRMEDGVPNDAALHKVSEHTSAAKSITSGPLWSIAAGVPVLGNNFSAVSKVSASANDVVSDALGPLIGTSSPVDWKSLKPSYGSIDLEQVADAGPTVLAAAEVLRSSYERVDTINTDSLLPAVAEPVITAKEFLRSAAETADTASLAVRLLPSMLGADGPRNYLMLVQNNAESRATGGIPGALAVVHAERGSVSLAAQGSASGLGTFDGPIEVDPEQVSLFSPRLGKHMQNVNLTPHFPTAAETSKAMWEIRNEGAWIDGVISVDPIVLSKLLGATGPVDLTDQTVLDLIQGTALPSSLTSANVVAVLLSDVYRELENPEVQDAYFAAVASEVFSAFTTHPGDNASLVGALASSVNEGRILLWSSDESEQELIASTRLAGDVAGPLTGRAAFGAYFNDGTGAKMDYYASRSVQLEQECGRDGYSEYVVHLSVTNDAPLDAASSLPRYVTGGGNFGVEPGHIRTNYVFYGPPGSLAKAATLNGERTDFSTGTHGQRPVGTVTVQLSPGESAELSLTFSKVAQDAEPSVHVTPGLDSVEDVVLPLIRSISCQ